VEFVFKETQRNQGVHVKQVFHGNSAKISRTCLLLKCGASNPALRTGRPVSRSTRRVTFEKRLFRGVNTTRPACTFASSESPGWRPSLRRMAPASTIWPLVESFTSMVRKSYPKIGRTTRRRVARTCSVGPRLFLAHRRRAADLQNRSALHLLHPGFPIIRLRQKCCGERPCGWCEKAISEAANPPTEQEKWRARLFLIAINHPHSGKIYGPCRTAKCGQNEPRCHPERSWQSELEPMKRLVYDFARR
jgi:hypothetical protein